MYNSFLENESRGINIVLYLNVLILPLEQYHNVKIEN